MDKQAQIKLGIVFLLIGILSCLFVLADIGEELSLSENIKEYNEVTKTAKISDKIGTDITLATLNTPQIYQVRVGEKVKIARFTINPYIDYENILGEFEINDLKDNGKKITRDITIKYLGIEDYSVNDYDCPETTKGKTGIELEDCVIIGSHIEQREAFIPWDKNAYANKEVIVELYMDMYAEETFDWKPTIANVKVEEWAVVTTGAVETIDGDYTVLTYANNGYFNVTGDTLNVSVLVVAGGGAAGYHHSGGGGAGGYQFDDDFDVTVGDYNVVVGLGGTGNTNDKAAGDNGDNSVFSTITAIGGGSSQNGVAGQNGGCGGGGGVPTGGVTDGGTGSQGGDGGTGYRLATGGGGGAGQNGENAGTDGTNYGGDGGNGISNSITGTAIYYAGGGGGESWTGIAGATGGLGGGGDGETINVGSGDDGVDGLGGGGGSGYLQSTASASGGSGVVIIRYLTSDAEDEDTIPPTYSNIQTNETCAGRTINFSMTWDDDTALHPHGTYIFSTNNTGTWTNESAINFTATPQAVYILKTLNSTSGVTVGYQWYAYDTALNPNGTGIQILTTTTCDYNRDVTEPFTTSNLIDRTSSHKRESIQILDTTELGERLADFFKIAIQSFNLNNLVDKVGNFFRTIIDNFNLNNIVEKFKGWYISVQESFGLNNIVNKLSSFIRTIPDTFNLNNIIERTGSFFREIVDNFQINNVTEGISSFLRKMVDNFNLNNIIDRVGTFFRTIIDNFNLNNIIDKISETAKRISTDYFQTIVNYTPSAIQRVVSVFRDVIQSFNLNNIIDRIGEFFKTIIQYFNLNNIVDRLRTVLREIVQSFGLNNMIEKVINIFREITQAFNINEIIEGIWGVFRAITQNLGINELTEKIGGFFRTIFGNFSINEIFDRGGGLSTIRNAIDTLTITNLVERTSDFFKTIIQSFGINELTEKLGNFFKTIIQSFNINNLVDKSKNWIISLSQSFSINELTEKIGNFFKTVTQSFNLNELTERIGSFFKTIIQSFGLRDITNKIGSSVRDISQSFEVNNLVEKLGSFFRDLTQSFSINELTERIGGMFRKVINILSINEVLDRGGGLSTIRSAIDSLTINNVIDKTGSFIRGISDTFNLNNIIDRTGNFFKTIIQSFSINELTERIGSFFITITQFFQMLFTLLGRGSFDNWAWTTSVETLTQGNAYEELRVPYGLHDEWTSDPASPNNWINTTKTYSLPTDCQNVQVKIDGVNRTYSILVNNTDCDYTIINNNSMNPGDTDFIILNYTTTATSSGEGTWIATNKRIGNQTHWTNTLTMLNPSTHDYINISTNITTDLVALPAFVNITKSTLPFTKFTHNFSNINGNTNWSLGSLDSLDNYIFVTDYRTDNVTINKTNYTQVISGKDYDVWNVTVEANSTRAMSGFYYYFNFSDTGVVANTLYECSSGLTNCTLDISNDLSTVWEDRDSDGSYDYVEWFNTLNQNQSYQLLNDRGFPVEITESKQILNKPIYIFDNILWQNTLTFYNPNAFSTTKVYKHEFPLGAVDIELDDIRKNLQYSAYGTLAPYVTIVDKDQIGSYPNSVYLAPGETKTFIITYRTESVTLDTSTYFPSHFEVGENGLISQVLRIKNQAEDNVTDIEYRIPLSYAEDLIICKGEFEKGCEDDKTNPEYLSSTIDAQSEVQGDYTLEVDFLESGETKYITLSYKTPTAKVLKIERGRRSISGNLTTFKHVFIQSQARFSMSDLRYKDVEIPCENIKEIYKCRANNLCDIQIGYTCNPLEVKLNFLGQGEEVDFFIWYVDTIPEEMDNWFTEGINWFMENIWNSEKRIEVRGIWKYIGGWLASEDTKTGELYIPSNRLIIVCSFVGIILSILVWRHFSKKKKIKTKNRLFGNLKEEIRKVKDKVNRKV